ncbi:MAG TPA: hypothetical protein VGI10_11685 [Polyangiaceae bacterium]|jgi:hypothetical protein
MRRLSIAAIFALVACFTLPVCAQSDGPSPSQIKAAAAAFDRGREAYKAEEYGEAAEQFESADSSAPSAQAIELAIRARDKAGELERAATLAALALQRHGDDPNIQKVAPGVIARAKSELYELKVHCDSECDLTVASKIVHGEPATDRTLYLAAGSYVVRAGWSGNRSLSKRAQATRGGSGTLDFEAPAEGSEPSEPAAADKPPQSKDESPTEAKEAPRSGWSPTVFWSGVGLTAVLAGVTTWSGLDTQNNPGADKVRASCSVGADDCKTLYNQGVRAQQRTNVLIGATAAVGVATVLVGALATDWGPPKLNIEGTDMARARRRRGFSIEPWFAVGGGASAGALGRF